MPFIPNDADVPGVDITDVLPAEFAEFSDRIGQCYYLVARFALADQSAGTRYVHGSIQKWDLPRNPHAWIEQGDQVVDLVLGRRMSVKEYKRWARARRDVSYSADELTELILRFEHSGPFDNERET